MKKNKSKYIVIFFIIVLILIISFVIVSSKTYYKSAINNIKNNYNNVFNIKINSKLSFKLKTEHTTNFVHSVNKIQKNNYDFVLENKDGIMYLYVNDKYSKFDMNSYFNMIDINKIDNCEYLNKNNESINLNGSKKIVNKNKYVCGNYNLYIYTTKVFNKYIKSMISYNDKSIEIMQDSLIYNNQFLTLKYINIRENNYILNLKYKNNEFNIFYTYNNYARYSLMHDSTKVSLVLDDPIALFINCDTKRYNKLQLTLTKEKIELKEKYNEVNIDELLSMIFSEEIYDLFK